MSASHSPDKFLPHLHQPSSEETDRLLSRRTSGELPEDLVNLSRVITAAAQQREGDCLALLELLRLLNELHYDIRDTLFREALPNNRQRLYRLLKDIEQEGGWPYIRRMKLTALLEHIHEDGGDANAVESANESAPDDVSS